MHDAPPIIARRHFLRDCGVGLGKIALGLVCWPLRRDAAGQRSRRRSRTSRRRPRRSFTCSWPGRRVSSICSTTSRRSSKYEGKPIPSEITGGQRFAFIRADAAVLGAAVQVREVRPVGRRDRRGAAAPGPDRRRHLPGPVGPHRPVQPRAGADLLQHRLRAAGPAEPGLVGDLRPRRGDDRPARVRRHVHRRSGISGGAANWSSGFLPSVYTGVRFRNQGDPILNVSSPKGVDPQLQKDTLDLVGAAQPEAARRRRRSGDRHADRVVRNGVSPAIVRARN